MNVILEANVTTIQDCNRPCGYKEWTLYARPREAKHRDRTGR